MLGLSLVYCSYGKLTLRLTFYYRFFVNITLGKVVCLEGKVIAHDLNHNQEILADGEGSVQFTSLHSTN
jgi:hypothetical protein